MKLIGRYIGIYFNILLVSFGISAVFFVVVFLVRPAFLGNIYYDLFGGFTPKFENQYLENTIILNRNNPANYNYQVTKTNFREIVFEEYFKRNNSPLQGYAKNFVSACEIYKAPEDCTVVIAIAKVETDLCKYLPSQSQKNCWGFGGAGPNRYLFVSYDVGINLVTNRLVNGYGPEYMVNPNAMEMTYCGPRESCRVWGDNVQSVMDDLEQLSIQLGFPSLYGLRKG